MTELRRKPEVDYYKVLQVDSEAEPEVIEAAYRALSKKYHPDLNRAADAMDRMSQINSAYNILSNPSKRRDYNSLRGNSGNRTAVSPATASSSSSNSNYWSSGNAPKPAGNNPSHASPSQGAAKPGPNSSVRQTSTNTGPGSFRPQNSYPSGGATYSDPARPQARVNPVPKRPPVEEEEPQGRSRLGLWLLIIFVVILLGVGGVLAQETLFGNPLKTSFIRQVSVSSIVTPGISRGPAVTTPASTPQLAAPVSREQVSAFLNGTDLYAGRVSDVGLTYPDVLQLRVKLASNGGVLNSESPAQGRTTDELDTLRQSEATAYNLIYTIFARYTDLNRINLVLLDAKNNPVYRADVARSAAYTFYSWHNISNQADPGVAIEAARQDRLIYHLGASLDDPTRSRLNSPSEANLQAELSSIGLSAFSVTGGTQPSINYFQVRNQAEMAVDFARIIYSLYTRFPGLDKLQIAVSTSPDKPVKVIDRQLFSQIGLEIWAQAAYGGASAGGDQEAQTLVAALPGNFADLHAVPVTIQSKFKTPVQVGNWYVVTESVERYDALTLEGLKFPATSGRQFLVVRVALRNTSDSSQWLMPGENMTLLDTKGQIYNSDPTATMLYILKTPPSSDPPPAPIEQNKQGAVYVAFSVPSNTNLSTLRLQFQDGDKKATLELS